MGVSIRQITGTFSYDTQAQPVNQDLRFNAAYQLAEGQGLDAQVGPHTITGRAWSGGGEIERVQLSDDGGFSWHDAQLGPQVSRWGWRAWRWEWRPRTPGDYELCCRATDSAGDSQPLEGPWNLHGFANNEVQRVPVTIEST